MAQRMVDLGGMAAPTQLAPTTALVAVAALFAGPHERLFAGQLAGFG